MDKQIKFSTNIFNLNSNINEILNYTDSNILLMYHLNGFLGNTFIEFCDINKTNKNFIRFISKNNFYVYCTTLEEQNYFETLKNWGVNIVNNRLGEKIFFDKKRKTVTEKIEVGHYRINKKWVHKYITEKRKKIFYIIKEQYQEFFMPKFDIAIMNPPWDTKTDLHVEVVNTILEKSGATTAISVMPNDFLKTDEYNKKHSRYRNTKIDTMLDCNDEFSIEDTNNLFGLSYSTNCSILCWNTNGSYDYDTVFNDTSKIKEQKKKIENIIQKLIKNDSIFKSHKKFVKLTEYNGTGYFIPIGTHGANIATEFGLIENNEKAYNYNGKEIFFDKEKFYSLTTNNNGKGIYVSSKNEGIRLLKLFRSENYMEFQKWTKFSCNGNFRHLLEFCPILKDNETIISEQTEKEILKLIKDIK